MPIPNWMIKVIAGSGKSPSVAEKSERKALEKRYQKVEAQLKAVTEVTYESHPHISSAQRSVYSTPETSLTLPPKEGTLRTSRPLVQRSQSDIGTNHVSGFRSPTGPPDITAQDLTDDGIKRNYGVDNVWNAETHGVPLPPLPQMKGFGKHRMYVGADQEFQMNHLKRTLSGLSSPLLDHLGDFEAAEVDPNIWKQYKALSQRTESVSSSRSSHSSCVQPIGDHLDAKTGTLISRGFSPSTTSSAASSFRDGSCHYRKDSMLSMTSTSSDADPKHRRRSSRHPSFKYGGETSSASPLTTITENHDLNTNPRRKIERACQFDETNTDSALASDASDDEELEWSDMLEAGMGGAGGTLGNLTKQLGQKTLHLPLLSQAGHPGRKSENKVRSQNPGRPGLDRSKTVKPVARPALRRSQSRRKTTQVKTSFSVAKEAQDITAAQGEVPAEADEKKAESLPSVVAVTDVQPSSNSSEEKDRPGDLGLYMTEGHKRKNEDDGASIHSDSTSHTVVPNTGRMIPDLPLRQRRERSSTILCASSGNTINAVPNPTARTNQG